MAKRHSGKLFRWLSYHMCHLAPKFFNLQCKLAANGKMSSTQLRMFPLKSCKLFRRKYQRGPLERRCGCFVLGD